MLVHALKNIGSLGGNSSSINKYIFVSCFFVCQRYVFRVHSAGLIMRMLCRETNNNADRKKYLGGGCMAWPLVNMAMLHFGMCISAHPHTESVRPCVGSEFNDFEHRPITSPPLHTGNTAHTHTITHTRRSFDQYLIARRSISHHVRPDGAAERYVC